MRPSSRERAQARAALAEALADLDRATFAGGGQAFDRAAVVLRAAARRYMVATEPRARGRLGAAALARVVELAEHGREDAAPVVGGQATDAGQHGAVNRFG
jgi:hypothetical protein